MRAFFFPLDEQERLTVQLTIFNICISVRSTIERYKKASASTSGTAPVIDVNSHVRIISFIFSLFKKKSNLIYNQTDKALHQHKYTGSQLTIL
jgi:hypothetical protein